MYLDILLNKRLIFKLLTEHYLGRWIPACLIFIKPELQHYILKCRHYLQQTGLIHQFC